ncbi:hypothetical protein [Frankia sp. CcWB2]
MARASVDAYQRTGGGFEDLGNAMLNLSLALLLRSKPEPEEAARHASEVVSMLNAIPTYSVTAKAGGISKHLDPFAELPPVKDLREQLGARPRLALTQ